MNAFSAGSSADITENVDMTAPGGMHLLNKNSSKQNLDNNGLIHVTGDDIYGTSTAAGTSKPNINFNGVRQSNSGFEPDNSFRDSGINGSIK
jgi:hypothetical protein